MSADAQRKYYQKNKDYYAEWRRNNADKMFRYLKNRRLNEIGTSIEEWERVWENQGGLCANKNCHTELKTGRGGATADHNHKTGLFRGILCNACNVALGQVNDSVEILEGLILYIKEREIRWHYHTVQTP